MSFRYRLALDLGSTSLGWSVLRLNEAFSPIAIVVSGVRIFSDGRSPKDGASLAVARRAARALRRRRDRFLKRRNRLIDLLIKYGFFPQDSGGRKALECLDPYQLRARGLDHALTPHEFGRAIFHLNQRRGFQSNRKTDGKDSEGSVMKTAISTVRTMLEQTGSRTVGEWLNQRKQQGQSVRARFHENRVQSEQGKSRIEKNYDLYIDRAMVRAEFAALWAAQAAVNPAVFHELARKELEDTLFFQRKLRPVDPGRCTFFPEEKRAPLALPSVQRFRIYQELNNLRWLDPQLQEHALTLAQRDAMVQLLEVGARTSFTKLRSKAGLGSVTFNIEDEKRPELKGNITSAILAKKTYFGSRWATFPAEFQDEIVGRLLAEENEAELLAWLVKATGVTESQAELIANVVLPDGYGSLSVKAIAQILPNLQDEVRTYDKAVMAAGIEHHSHLGAGATGEILPDLPYYGYALPRYVGFGTGKLTDSEEKRYGKISNPTVHIGLNQVRVVVNELIQRYGHPSQIVVELARDLKLSREQQREIAKQQADNQKRNDRFRTEIADVLGISRERVKRDLLEKRILWEELSFDPTNRRCPYSGVQISLHMLLSDQVEIEHILPFSKTLDDSLNNKTVSLRQANRVKGSLTPWEAFGRQSAAGFDYETILARAQAMPLHKRYRFAPDGMQRWLKEDKDFLARALNDTRYLSRVAKEYLSLICPQATWASPGRLTAMLRRNYGLNDADILGWNGQKNRDDHRHHAIDACVIGIMDRGLLQRVAVASAQSREKMLDRLVAEMPLPWPSYREHVKRAVARIWVSHKPDHSYEKAMHNDTAYGLLDDGRVQFHKKVEGVRQKIIDNLSVIPFTSLKAGSRHGYLSDGSPKPYKGYKGDSNYCIEILRNDDSVAWQSEVISTYEAYQLIRKYGKEVGWRQLRDGRHGVHGKPLVMRLMIDDVVRLEHEGVVRTLRVVSISGNGQVFFADIHEANTDARNRDKENPFKYISKKASSLQKSRARKLTISPAGRLRDPGFKP